MIGSLVAYEALECEPVELVRRIDALTQTRDGLRQAHARHTGCIMQTPLLDGAIERLEELLAAHLPQKPPEELL